MPALINGNEVSGMMFGSTPIAEAWMDGSLVWSDVPLAPFESVTIDFAGSQPVPGSQSGDISLIAGIDDLDPGFEDYAVSFTSPVTATHAMNEANPPYTSYPVGSTIPNGIHVYGPFMYSGPITFTRV